MIYTFMDNIYFIGLAHGKMTIILFFLGGG